MRAAVAAFRKPILGKSIWQIINSFAPFILVCAAMYALVDVSYVATLGLAVLAAGFVVRIFILQHDCGHYAFFESRRANAALGTICSLITLTPFVHWREQHAQHHRVWNNLDRRDTGLDFYSNCITRAEFETFTAWQKVKHRLIYNPLVSLIILPPLIFLVLYRLPFDTKKGRWKEHLSVHVTNLGVAAIIVGLGFALGFLNVLAVQLPIIIIASIVGVWLFSVQHRFESALWTRQEQWDGVTASLAGSSFLKLPRALQWITGNIGYHHIHHLNPLVPNYRLQECHDRIPELKTVPAMSLWQALKSSRYILWDEDQAKLIGAGRAAEA